jgi:hypothetical protein
VSYDDGRIACTDDALVYVSSQRVRPVITPDDPEKVAAELAGRGVNVS